MSKATIKATLLNHMGEDVDTANAARVSFGKTSELECLDYKKGVYDLKQGDKNLISFLGSHDHISPFGHSFARFHVKAPIFVARHLVKNKFLRWNEISGRYVEFGVDLETGEPLSPEEIFYIPEAFREFAKDKKQGSSKEEVTHITWDEVDPESGQTYEVGGTAQEVYLRASADALETYRRAINNYMCPEQARMILPSNLMVEWWWSGSLDAFAQMYNLRIGEDAQVETQMVAKDVGKELSELFPYSWRALTNG